MALLPEIHLNVGDVTFGRIYQFFLPLIPGCTLVGGLTLTHAKSVNDIAGSLGLGHYSRAAILLCGSYVAGLVLYAFSMAMVGMCSILLNPVVYKKWPPTRPNEVASQSIIFRRVASEFLGPLTPLQVPNFPATVGNDVEWLDFYNVLQDYVLRSATVLNNELMLFITNMQGTAWALMYLYWRTAMRGHWSVLVLCVILILFTVTFPFVVQLFYWKYDRLTPWDFIARLINEIKIREKSNAPPAQI